MLNEANSWGNREEPTPSGVNIIWKKGDEFKIQTRIPLSGEQADIGRVKGVAVKIPNLKHTCPRIHMASAERTEQGSQTSIAAVRTSYFVAKWPSCIVPADRCRARQ